MWRSKNVRIRLREMFVISSRKGMRGAGKYYRSASGFAPVKANSFDTDDGDDSVIY